MNVPWEAIITLGLYLVGSTVGFIWWMATMTEQVKNLTAMVIKLTEMDGTYARKDDVSKEFALFERQQEAIWKKYDSLKERVDRGRENHEQN